MPVRAATSDDLDEICALIVELAEYEELVHEVEFDRDEVGRHLFGPEPAASVLIAETDASRATVITYVCPLVALAVGIPILGEELTATSAAGLLLILLGSWLATRDRGTTWTTTRPSPTTS